MDGARRLPAQQLIYAEPSHDGWTVYSIHGGYAPGCDERRFDRNGSVTDRAKQIKSAP